MPDGTSTDMFHEAHPDRYFDVGIAEGHGVTFAAGLAIDRVRPVVAIYSTFLQRGFDNIVHDVALQGLPVVFGMDRAGIARSLLIAVRCGDYRVKDSHEVPYADVAEIVIRKSYTEPHVPPHVHAATWRW